jgi:hypothetical protein
LHDANIKDDIALLQKSAELIDKLETYPPLQKNSQSTLSSHGQHLRIGNGTFKDRFLNRLAINDGVTAIPTSSLACISRTF